MQKNNKSIKFFTFPYKIDIEKNIKKIKSVNLSETATSIEYIVLEATPSSLVQNINQIAISDSIIFICNFKMLLMFNQNGEFIKQIGSWGRGPGEYRYINDFYVDYKNGIIYILDTGEVLEYNFKGDFNRKFIVPRYSSSFSMTNAEKFILYQFNLPLDSIDRKYSWFITDLNGNIKEAIHNRLKRTKTPGMLIRKRPLYNFKNSIHFIEFGSDTLFQLSNNLPEPYAIFNFGKLKMPYDFYLPSRGEREILNKYLWLSTVKEDNQFLFFSVTMGISDSSKYGIFNKGTFEIAFIKNNFFINDIDEGPPFWPERIYNNTIMVSWIEGFKLLEFINKKLANKSGFRNAGNRKKFEILKSRLTETSNPVLMIAR